jgi:hypothetical protein
MDSLTFDACTKVSLIFERNAVIFLVVLRHVRVSEGRSDCENDAAKDGSRGRRLRRLYIAATFLPLVLSTLSSFLSCVDTVLQRCLFR